MKIVMVQYIPKPSDSNRQVSSTPTSLHQDKKFAVLSRAKNDPGGALALHGIFFTGIIYIKKKPTTLSICIVCEGSLHSMDRYLLL